MLDKCSTARWEDKKERLQESARKKNWMLVGDSISTLPSPFPCFALWPRNSFPGFSKLYARTAAGCCCSQRQGSYCFRPMQIWGRASCSFSGSDKKWESVFSSVVPQLLFIFRSSSTPPAFPAAGLMPDRYSSLSIQPARLVVVSHPLPIHVLLPATRQFWQLVRKGGICNWKQRAGHASHTRTTGIRSLRCHREN